MQRFVYQPRVEAYIRLEATNRVIDISDDIISGSITRRLGALSEATLTLQNKMGRYTKTYAMEPMDRIAIRLGRIGPTMLVFSGYLDEVPMQQIYPAPVTLRASCTLKLLQYTFFDPGLPFLSQYFASFGWSYDPSTGTLRDGAGGTTYGAAGNFDINGGVADIIYHVLQDIGNWPAEAIQIYNLPGDFIQAITALFKQTNLDNQEEYTKQLTRMKKIFQIGAGGAPGSGQGSGGATDNNGPYGTVTPTGNITALDVAKLVLRVGFTGEAAVTAVAVAGAESSFFTQAVGDLGTGGSFGLWQIHYVDWHSQDETVDQFKARMFDPNQCAAKAREIFSALGWKPWSTYNSGAYLSWMQIARDAINQALTSASQPTTTDSSSSNTTSSSTDTTGTTVKIGAFTFQVGGNSVYTGPIIPNPTPGREPDETDFIKKYGQDWATIWADWTIQQSYGNPQPTTQSSDVNTNPDGSGFWSNIGDIIGNTVDTVGSNIVSAFDNFEQTQARTKATNAVVIAIAESKKGITEVGTSNAGPQIQKYENVTGAVGEAWCGSFVSWVYLQAGRDIRPQIPHPESVQNILEYARSHGWVQPTDQARGGDMIAWDGPGTEDHVGIVVKNNGDGTVDYVSGNTPNPNDPAAEWGVFRKTVSLSDSAEGTVVIIRPSGMGPPDPRSELMSPEDLPPNQMDTGGASIQGNEIAQIAKQAAWFTIQLQTNNVAQSLRLKGERAIANDISLMEWISALVASSGRVFSSTPSGDFLAFYPDRFGWFERTPYFLVTDIELLDLTIQKNDTNLATHVFASGHQAQIDIADIDRGIPAVASVEDANGVAFKAFIGVDPTDPTVTIPGTDLKPVQFLQQYGARPYVYNLDNVRHPMLVWMAAWMKFTELWANQYQANASFTFMPELLPGGIVQLHGELTMFIEEVTHTFDRSAGFTTNATLSSPASLTNKIGKKKLSGLPLDPHGFLMSGDPMMTGQTQDVASTKSSHRTKARAE